jgi:adenosylhomocysteine nucleosidase
MASTDHPARVGLLAPMPSEMGPVVKAMGLERPEGESYYRGRVGPAAVTAGRTGIGTKRAAEATERLLDAVDVDHVLVVGIAGGMGTTALGAVLFPEVAVDRATGTEYRSTPVGGITPKGKLVTHDDYDMGPGAHEQLVADGFAAVDMETAAVAAVCEQRGVPWFAVRAISDLVGVTPSDVIDLANADGSPNISASVKYLVTKPWRIPKLLKLGLDARNAANSAARAATRSLSG